MTVKITCFTCVLIPNVVRLYFWQSKTEKIAKLVLSAIKNQSTVGIITQGKPVL